MKLSEAQQIFAQNVARLIAWTPSNHGYSITLGEALRTPEQQLLYFEGKTLAKIGSDIHFVQATRKTKTMDSQHLKKLAIDLNLFIDGEYQTGKEAYKPLAEYWKSLHPNNVAGYDWSWDSNHFEMKI